MLGWAMSGGFTCREVRRIGPCLGFMGSLWGFDNDGDLSRMRGGASMRGDTGEMVIGTGGGTRACGSIRRPTTAATRMPH